MPDIFDEVYCVCKCTPNHMQYVNIFILFNIVPDIRSGF